MFVTFSNLQPHNGVSFFKNIRFWEYQHCIMVKWTLIYHDTTTTSIPVSRCFGYSRSINAFTKTEGHSALLLKYFNTLENEVWWQVPCNHLFMIPTLLSIYYTFLRYFSNNSNYEANASELLENFEVMSRKG